MGEVTQLMKLIQQGNSEATAELYELVYAELRRMAQARMRKESPDHILQPTALVNEVFLKLVHRDVSEWEDRRHFYGVASEAMRRILIDAARSRNRKKRGGDHERQPLDENTPWTLPFDTDLIDLDVALRKLEELAPDKAEVVRLHFFAGLTFEQVASVLGISKSTVERRWRFSRSWLRFQIENLGDTDSADSFHSPSGDDE